MFVMLKKHWDCVLYPPGMESPAEVDQFAMEFYFQEMLTVVLFSMLFWRLRRRGTYSKFDQILQNQKEMSRKAMEMELFLNECPGILKRGIFKPKKCTNVFT